MRGKGRQNKQQHIFSSRLISLVGVSLVHTPTGHDLPDTVLSVCWEIESWKLLLQCFYGTIASAVAIETCCHVGGDELVVSEVQGLQDVSLLA